MDKKVVRSILTCMMAVILLASGCGGKKSSSSGSSEKRDNLNFAFIAESKELDPAKSSDTLTYIILLQIFDTLIKVGPDGKLTPALAEKWKISADGKEILFTIKKGVKFHNGDVMTAEDVAYSLNRTIKSAFTQKFTGVMQSANVVDGSTVKLKLKSSYGPILYCIANPCVAIVSKKAVEQAGDGYGRNPVGTGPYKFVKWVSGEKIVVERFDDYFKGPAKIKNVTFKFITDTSTAAVALEKGEIDVLHNPAKSDRAAQLGNKNLTYYEADSAYYYHISMNNKTGPFSDKRVRLAVSYALDRVAIVLGGLDGNGLPLECPMPPSVFGFQLGFKNNPYNPEKARQLLAEAGYSKGLTVKFKVNQAPMYSKPAEVIQEQLRKVGIKAEIELMERAAYLEDVTKKFNYDISLYVITALLPDADYVCYTRLHSSMLGNGNNFTVTKIPQLDAALDLARVSQDKDVRKKAYLKVSQIVKDEAPLIPVMTGKYAIVANKNLNGVSSSTIDLHYVHDYSWKEEQNVKK
jgi:peptide/nickel transport system substrate-binding protein